MAGIYIHVPFCKKRCIYCDFYTNTNLTPKKGYIDAVCKEISLRKSYIGDELIKTIYFGGGTPSLLDFNDFTAIFSSIRSNFRIDANPEITLEANPDDLNEDYLRILSNQPFNRISIGIQSFDDEELTFLNRRHSAEQAIKAVELSKAYGFRNISIDLMYGLPSQTMDIWKDNLDKAISLGIQHISSYHLIYEEGTKLYKLLNQGSIKTVDEELSIEMFSVMIDSLTSAGFEHYEISNFAKNGLYSKHNSSYWLAEKYLGLGPAAHSYNGENRSWNIASTVKYIEGIKQANPNQEIEELDIYTHYNDFILTGLRTMWGINLNELERLFGKDMRQYTSRNIQMYIDKGLVRNSNDVLTITRDGIFISDTIMSDLMWIK